VLALDVVARWHQPIGELTGIGEQQQTFGVVIETPDADPLAVADRRQLLEHRRAAFGIVARDDLAGGLVVDEHARSRFGEADLDELAVDTDFVARADLLSDFGRHPVHRDAAGEDHLLPCAARAERARGATLGQALRFAERWYSG